MDILKLVTEARSCRRFEESEPLGQQDLKWLVECARRAPSARNAQQLRFMTITGDTTLKLFELTRWAGALKDWNGPYAGERPTAFIATLMPENGGDLVYIDVGIACQTIQLAATSRGWGACMIYSFDRGKVWDLLSIPDDFKVALLMGLGVAREQRQIAPMPEDGDFSYWRDENQVHYVPKRGLDELIVRQFEK